MPGKQLHGQAEDHTGRNKQVLFIRHGESEAHVGKAATHIEAVGLTSSGKELAQRIANEFTCSPDLIIVSPYLRAWETAAPTMKRFPSVPHAIWKDVREFTYLGSLVGLYLTKDERSGHVKRYWGNCNPDAKDGNGESFAEFVGRARRVLRDLRKELERRDFIVVFTHEQFIRAVQCLLLRWQNDTENKPECMKQFRKMLVEYPLDYGYKDEESWQLHLAQRQVCPLEEDIPQLEIPLSSHLIVPSGAS